MTTIAETFQKQARGAASSFVWLGAALIALGVAALVWPMFSTLAATVFVGAVLLVSGVVGVFGAFSIRGAGPFFGALLYSLLSVAAGVYMLARPAAGELAITLTLGILFVFQGAFEGVLTYELRRTKTWGWMLVSALASIFLAFVIISSFPSISTIALGVILGVNFITSGIGYVFAGNAVKSAV